MKKSRSLTAGAFIAVLVSVLFAVMNGDDMLAKNITIDTYALRGRPIGDALISIPYANATDLDVRLNAYVDWNADTQFEDEEWMVRSAVPLIREDGMNRFAVSVPPSTTLPSEIFVRITLEKASDSTNTVLDSVEVDAPVDRHELTTLWDIITPGSNEHLKRGIFTNAAQAKNEMQIPDLQSGPMDCAAVALGNIALGFAELHGRRAELPVDPQTIIGALNREMKFQNGVLVENIAPAVQAFSAQYRFPLKATVIARPTFDDLARALQAGSAVMLSMAHVQSASSLPDAGHVVTAVRAINIGAQTGIFVHDPATPEGDDFLAINPPPNKHSRWRIDYPLWDGVSVMDHLIVVNWEAAEKTSSSVASEK